jgi:TolA-binding protein
MDKDFTNAIENYENGSMLKQVDMDYALYQKALAQGALAKLENKASSLIYLVDTYKNSNYRGPALFELANTYQNLNNNAKAIEYYDKLISEYPNSSYVSQSLLKKGLIYFNESKDDQALTVLKKVVSDFPGTSESKEALVSIRNIYVDMDKVEDFFIYVKDLPFASVSNSEQDSITYIAVENRYMRNDCENASKGFKDYISKFPEGVYQLDAHFYLAECQFRASATDEALQNYLFVITKLRSKFTETSLLNAADISFSKKDYATAVSLYGDLEKNAEYKENIITAIAGQMRCNFQLALYQTTIDNARKLISKEKLPEELIAESHLTIAKSALAIDSVSLGMAELIMVGKITKSEMAAEAKYLLAELYFKQGNNAETKNTAYDIINLYPSYNYWLAKTFILLADYYLKIGNPLQAKSTLKSVIDNYEGADLIKVAQEKLDKIVADEKAEEQRKAEELLKQQNEPDPSLDINIIK